MDRRPSASTLLNLSLAIAVAVALVLIALPNEESPGVLVEARDPPGGLDEIRVHIAGEVVQPGVVRLQPGDRVQDAVALAGGATAAGDPDALNLARRVVDGERIEVPRAGEAAAPLDLNEASLSALETLPGVGPARAGAIIAARSTARFTSSDELVSRGILPASVYERLRDLVATPSR